MQSVQTYMHPSGPPIMVSWIKSLPFCGTHHAMAGCWAAFSARLSLARPQHSVSMWRQPAAC